MIMFKQNSVINHAANSTLRVQMTTVKHSLYSSPKDCSRVFFFCGSSWAPPWIPSYLDVGQYYHGTYFGIELFL